MTRVEEIQKVIAALDQEKQEYFWNYYGKMPDKILEKGQILKLSKGKEFVREGEKVNKIYILLSGKVEGIEYRVWKMEYGYFLFDAVKSFGTMEVSLEQDVYQTTLKTVSEAVFLVFSKKDFESWFWNELTAVTAQLKEMGQYLYAQSSRERLRALLPGKDRLSLYLVQTYERNAVNGEYLVPYSSEELAHKIGVAERTVTRARKVLIEQDFVSVVGKKLLITRAGYKKMKENIKEIMIDL